MPGPRPAERCDSYSIEQGITHFALGWLTGPRDGSHGTCQVGDVVAIDIQEGNVRREGLVVKQHVAVVAHVASCTGCRVKPVHLCSTPALGLSKSSWAIWTERDKQFNGNLTHEQSCGTGEGQMAQTGIMEELAKQNPYRDYDPTVLSGVFRMQRGCMRRHLNSVP